MKIISIAHTHAARTRGKRTCAPRQTARAAACARRRSMRARQHHACALYALCNITPTFRTAILCATLCPLTTFAPLRIVFSVRATRASHLPRRALFTTHRRHLQRRSISPFSPLLVHHKRACRTITAVALLCLLLRRFAAPYLLILPPLANNAVGNMRALALRFGRHVFAWTRRKDERVCAPAAPQRPCCDKIFLCATTAVLRRRASPFSVPLPAAAHA